MIGPTGLDRAVCPAREGDRMEWWAWALIALGALALGWVKLKVFAKILQKKKKGPAVKDED